MKNSLVRIEDPKVLESIKIHPEIVYLLNNKWEVWHFTGKSPLYDDGEILYGLPGKTAKPVSCEQALRVQQNL